MLARRLLLIDLSNNNSVDSLAHARAAGVVGCWLKVGEGNTYTDPTYRHLRELAAAGGLRSGGYYFARPEPHYAVHQAERFAELLGSIGRRDLRPVLDLETSDHGPAGPWLGQWAVEFLQAFRRATGVCCLVYSYAPFLEALQLARPIGCGLWLAAYGRNNGPEYPYQVPAPWRRAVAHQFTSRGRLAGVAGDVDVTSAPALRPLLAHGVRGL